MKEIWKPIKFYHGMYEVSNLGRVRSLSRMTPGLNGLKLSPGRILRPNLRTGYPSVALTKADNQKYFRIHRLLAEAFIPKRPGKDFVNHKDGNRTNNSLDNLEWCSQHENLKNAIDRGTLIFKRLLTLQEAGEIKKMIKLGDAQANIAKKFDVHQATIAAIKAGKAYRYVR